jgi:phage internal scaffolding protein
MERFEKTGVLEHRNRFEGSYGDFTNTPQDYHDAVNQVLAADEMFQSLPARVRKRFGNDPAEFVDFVSDPANVDEMRSLGLLKPVGSSEVVEPVSASKAASAASKSASSSESKSDSGSEPE